MTTFREWLVEKEAEELNEAKARRLLTMINESSRSISNLKIDRISHNASMSDPSILLAVKMGYEEFNFVFHLYKKKVKYRLYGRQLEASYSSKVDNAIRSLEDSNDMGEPFNKSDEKVILEYVAILLK